jgi:hypothetical protein
MGRVMQALPIAWAARLTLPWTLFEVTVAYQNGVVEEVHIVKMQQDIQGMLHPNAASTTVLSSRLGQQLRYLPSLPSAFKGYSMNSRCTGQEGADGKLTCFSEFLL